MISSQNHWFKASNIFVAVTQEFDKRIIRNSAHITGTKILGPSFQFLRQSRSNLKIYLGA